MYRQFYFPPTITIGRLSGEHIPAEFGFAIVLGSGYALLEHRLRGHWLLVLSATGYFSILATFGAHIQKTEYHFLESAKGNMARNCRNSADAQEGMPILIDLEGIPRTQAFGAFWLQGSAQITLPRLVVLPPNFRRPPLVVGYSRYAEYERRGEGLPLKIPVWQPDLWPLV